MSVFVFVSVSVSVSVFVFVFEGGSRLHLFRLSWGESVGESRR